MGFIRGLLMGIVISGTLTLAAINTPTTKVTDPIRSTKTISTIFILLGSLALVGITIVDELTKEDGER